MRATERGSRIAFGPLRVRRIGLSAGLPLLTVYSDESLLFTTLVVTVGVVLFARSLVIGVSYKGGRISVVNLLGTTAVDVSDINCVSFVSYGVGRIHRLVLRTHDGRSIPANGASVWVWPLVLPIHRPRRYRDRVERFAAEAGMEPVLKMDW